MAIILTESILNTLILKHTAELCNIINNLNILDKVISINTTNISLNKKFIPNNTNRCYAKNSQNNQCKRKQLSNNKYCKKHIDSNKGDFNNSSINLKSNIIIECEYITINYIEYIYNINNNLLFNNNLYSPDCIGIYLNNIIHYYTD